MTAGTTAVVTGSSSGSRFACAGALAEAGHTTAVTGTTARVLERAVEMTAIGATVVGVVTDLTTADGVERLTAAARWIDLRCRCWWTTWE